MTASLILLGLVLGALVSLLNVLYVRRELSTFEVTTYLIGGTVGGLLAAMCILPDGSISRQSIALILLAGFFSAQTFASLLFWRRA